MLAWCAACAAPQDRSVRHGEPGKDSRPPPEAVLPEPAGGPAPQPQETIETVLPTIPYSIQVGAFSTAERAEAYAEVLQRSGLETFYFVDTDGLFKVRIERFDSRDMALQRAAALQSGGLIDHYFIVNPLPAEGWDELAVVRNELLQTALRFIGTPYRWGGASPAEGFDCSGLTRTVYRLNGLELPRRADEQFRKGTAVPRGQIEVGDLLFFDIGRSGRVSHVGIYCGLDRFIHAPGKGKQVRTGSLSDAYFAKRYLGARRYF